MCILLLKYNPERKRIQNTSKLSLVELLNALWTVFFLISIINISAFDQDEIENLEFCFNLSGNFGVIIASKEKGFWNSRRM
jgi:hypothetical protein